MLLIKSGDVYEVGLPNQRRSKLNGFTLIELLVVIAVISILAAILFPVFATAREKARQSACLSNLKQLGLAFTQYANDYDETYPVAGYFAFSGTIYHDGAGWAGDVYPYVKSPQLFDCPSDPTVADTNGVPVSYAYNTVITFPASNGSGVDGHLTKMTSPSKTVMLFEVRNCLAPISAVDENYATNSNNFSPAGYGVDCQIYQFAKNSIPATTPVGRPQKFATGYMDNSNYTSTTCNSYSDGPDGRHQRMANYLLADCHVKAVVGSLVSTGLVAVNSTDSQTASLAEGTEKNGHTLTFSTK